MAPTPDAAAAGPVPSTSTYPVNLRLTARRVLVVGGGHVAARKVAGLLRARAVITIVAPDAVREIADNADVRWFTRPYQRGEVASYRLAVAATGIAVVDRQVAIDGDRAGVWVNSVDDPDHCSFTLPAVARHGDLQIAISTSGRSPALARWIRRRCEQEISAGYDQLIELLSEVRAEAREELGTSELDGWDAALDDGVIELVRRGRIERARSVLRDHLGLSSHVPGTAP